MKQIRLMLVDDHEIVRTGLKNFLESHSEFTVVAEAGNGTTAIETALEARPDIIVMDISMPEMDGLRATRQLKAEWPDATVLALTVHEDKYYFMEMLAAGVAGYLTKRAASEELVLAIKSVADGHIYLQPALARWLLEDYQRMLNEDETEQEKIDEPAVGLNALSKREREVLELVAKGLSNQLIGKQLDLSPKTIARHRERIMNKLNLHSRTELVKFAIRTGLVDLD